MLGGAPREGWGEGGNSRGKRERTIDEFLWQRGLVGSCSCFFPLVKGLKIWEGGSWWATCGLALRNPSRSRLSLFTQKTGMFVSAINSSLPLAVDCINGPISYASLHVLCRVTLQSEWNFHPGCLFPLTNGILVDKMQAYWAFSHLCFYYHHEKDELSLVLSPHQ